MYMFINCITNDIEELIFFSADEKNPTQLFFVGYLGKKAVMLPKTAACLESTLSLQSL